VVPVFQIANRARRRRQAAKKKRRARYINVFVTLNNGMFSVRSNRLS